MNRVQTFHTVNASVASSKSCPNSKISMKLEENTVTMTFGRKEVKLGKFITAKIDVFICHEWLEGGAGDSLRNNGVNKAWNPTKHYARPTDDVDLKEAEKWA